MKKLFLGLISAILTSSLYANTFPTDNPDSIALFSHNLFLASFDANSNGITIKVPATEDNVTIEVYDGDITAPTFTTNYFQQNPLILDMTFVGTYDIPLLTATEASIFNIYTDPELDGINQGETPIATIPSSIAMDSTWTTLVDMPNLQAALTADQSEYGYHVEYSFQTSDGTNFYKYRSNGGVYALAYNTIGINTPQRSAAPFTAYDTDGDFILTFNLDQEVCFIDIVDGDFDLTNDSDDGNTPSDIADQLNASPLFNIQTASVLDEAAIMGMPQDDTAGLLNGTIIIDGQVVNNGNFEIRRSPNVQYIVSGDEFVAQNVDPSGNQELELFRIKSTAPGCANAVPEILPSLGHDVEVDAISAGDYYISILGLDKVNTIFLAVSQDVTSVPSSVCQSGQFVSVIFEYIGDIGINVLMKNPNGTVYFDGYVEPGDLVPIAGVGGSVLNGNVDIFINGSNKRNARFKTPCSGHYKGELIGDYFSLRSGITNNRQAIN